MAPKSKSPNKADSVDAPGPKKAKTSDDSPSVADAPVTTGAKAVAAGADEIPRTVMERRKRPEAGLVLIHWNVGGLNGLLKKDERKARWALSRLVRRASHARTSPCQTPLTICTLALQVGGTRRSGAP
jgi:hypothetical protein